MVAPYGQQRSSAVFDPAALRLPRFDVSEGGQASGPAPFFKPTGVEGRAPSSPSLMDVDQLYQSTSGGASARDKARPPSRAASSIYGGSALYQPLMHTPHNSVWGNSTLFHNGRPPSDPGSAANAPPTAAESGRKVIADPPRTQQFGTGADSSPMPTFGEMEKRLTMMVEPMIFPIVRKSGTNGAEWQIFQRLCALQTALGVVLFCVGAARLAVSRPKTLGLELVYGVYVVVLGALGVGGSMRRDWRLLTACCLMNVLSCLLCIPPFVTGLLFTVPDTWTSLWKADPKLFASDEVPYGLDTFLSVICVLQWLVSVVTLAKACSAVGKFVGNVLKVAEERGEKTTEAYSDLSSAQQRAALKM